MESVQTSIPLAADQVDGRATDNNPRALVNCVSTAFRQDAPLGQETAPDIVMITSDGVQFHLHAAVLNAVSTNDFDGLLSPQAVPVSTNTLHVDEPAAVMELALHAAYCLRNTSSPGMSILSRTVPALIDKYRFDKATHFAPGSVLFEALVSEAFSRPENLAGALDVYALAAKYDLRSVATTVSEHLVSLDLSMITEEWAAEVGGVYFLWLGLLLRDRVDALRRILAKDPSPLHAPTPTCGLEDQQRNVNGPWTSAVARLITDARADMPQVMIDTTLSTIAERSPCIMCRLLISVRVRKVLDEWAAVKRTI